MRLQVLTLLAVGCCLLPAARATELAPIIAESRITDVTVYGDRADVRRVAEGLPLRSGTNVVRFAALPAQVDPSSVRASGSGDGTVAIVNVDVKRVAEVQESASDLVMELDESKRRLREWEARRAGLQAGKEFLNSVRLTRSEDGGRLLEVNPAGPEILSATVAFLTEETGKNQLESTEVAETIRQLKKRVREIQKEIYSRGSNQEFAWNVDVELDAMAAGECDLIVEYTTTGARWSAEYDVIVSEDLESIEVLYSANVSQATGEDWSDVSLSLSSAQPALGARLPALSAWWLITPRPAPVQLPPASENTFVRGGRSSAVETLAELPPGSVTSSSIRVIDTREQSKLRAINTMDSALDAAGIFATSFEISARQDLPSDGRSRRLRITSVDVEGEIRHESVPAHLAHVFLVASVRNTSDYPMLAGPSRVLLGGNFLGRGRIENVAPGQEFDLSLGVDRSVMVERTMVERQDDQSGSRHESQATYEIQITNHRDAPVTVTLRDQIPVSSDKDISVRLRDVEPKLATKPDGDGILEWKLEIPSGDLRTAGFRYEVKYPAGRRPRNL